VQPKTDITIGDKVDIYLINELKEDDLTCLNIGILTASDRAYNGIYGDKSGSEIQRILQDTIDDKKTKYQIFYKLVDDDKEKIKETLLTLTEGLCCTLVFTTGGTGPDFRDWTDVATEEVCHKILPGFGEIMRTRNFDMVPTSILSAQTAGIRYIYENKGSLIVNLPGKPEAIGDCLKIILKSVPKCLNIIHSADLFLKPNASLSQ
jgi:molybdopterin adenylyltransferase